VRSLTSKNAVRRGNSWFSGLRARIAPVAASISVTTWLAHRERCSPSTHSTMPNTLSPRFRPERFSSRSTKNFTGASRARIR
jgi:hypothetical protein